ncbi:thiolase family protein [Candidatus Moduliflexota bacterium]
MPAKIAITGGVRTPYVKAGTLFAGLTSVDLGRMAAAELIARTGIDPDAVDSVIVGNVAQPVEAVNVARVIGLYAGVPERVPAFTVHRNCASGMQAIVSAAQSIRDGEAEVVIAAGVESMSNIPYFLSRPMQDLTAKLLHSRSLKKKLALLLKVRPRHFVPRVGLILGLTDPTCRLSMGQTAEVLARELGISREAQDEFALMSHVRAAEARGQGIFNEEIMPVLPPPGYGEVVKFDNGVRLDETMEALARLHPYFDRKYGSVTAGNSSQITDGAAAVLVTSEKAASRLGLDPLGFVVDHAFAGLAPERMGLGPSYSTSILLEKTGIDFSRIGLIEINEAFAAQVIANEMVFRDDALSERYLGRKAIGDIDREILNVNGGAIAMGHPVGSSGTRLVHHLLLEMTRKKVDLGLATLCVGGGQGGAMLLERA